MNEAVATKRRRKGTELAVVDGGKSGAARARDVDASKNPREHLMNAAEAAEMLGLALGTIRNMTSRGELEHVKAGRRAVRYRESALLRWIEHNTIRINR